MIISSALSVAASTSSSGGRVAAFRQGNMTRSRKRITPIIDESLERQCVIEKAKALAKL
jgi:hypothetical protein|tara:strand:- start:1379 stop:1555 length:177 start_codon:yes stop_codon:yes gene_type:complete